MCGAPKSPSEPTQYPPESASDQTTKPAGGLRAPLDPDTADTPEVLHQADRRLVVQHTDSELAVLDAKSGTVTHIPATWPRYFGTITISPDSDTAVYCGTLTVRCVDASGAIRWEA
ncbi:hypothetical protein ACFU9B_03760 [Streptomyces sp. NPDC057592]|uniref:hypothetical protein n=1 Tax=Streptomyces sp. NPDC057592 TaxID=3346175 RepID=UPI0036812587